MAASRLDTWACQPATQRGRGLLLGAHPASRWIAYCTGRAVVLRSLTDPRLCSVYSEHSYPTTVARFSPNGEWVASGDSSGVVKVWARWGEHALKLETRPFAGSIDDLAWSHDGERIVACGDGKKHFIRAFIWDTGASLGDFDGHSKRVLSCAFRPKRPFRIWSCGEDFALNIYEGPPFRFKASHRLHTNFANCVRISPDGARAVSVSSDKKGFIFDALSGEKLGELSTSGGHTGSIYAVEWSPDSKHLLTVSADRTAKVWSIAESGSRGDVVRTFKISASGVEQVLPGASTGLAGPAPPVDYMQVGCLWLGDSIVTMSLNASINVITVPHSFALDASAPVPAPTSDPAPGPAPSPLQVTYIQGHTKTVDCIALEDAPTPTEGGADSRRLFTASYDGTVVCWEGLRGVGALVGGQSHNSIVGMACAGAQLITVGLDNTMKLTPLSGTLSFSCATAPVALSGQPRSLCAVEGEPLHSGERPLPLILVATTKGLQLFRGSSLVCSTPLPFDPSAVALAPNRKYAAVGSKADGNIQLFSLDSATGQLEKSAVLVRHRGPITALAYSPDGKFLASGDQNREAVVWDCATGEAFLKNLVYHNARISCLAWSPDSTRLATGSIDMSFIVYRMGDPPSNRVTVTGSHLGGVSALIFRGPLFLVSAGADACLKVWELHNET